MVGPDANRTGHNADYGAGAAAESVAVMRPYYDADGVTIYHGRDLDVLPSLGPVDMIFTSPPYNLGMTTGGGFGHYAADAGFGAARGGSLPQRRAHQTVPIG